jgi:GH25 family lysozyme M1 (1,4-beta-N-acetylmuramidase)
MIVRMAIAVAIGIIFSLMSSLPASAVPSGYSVGGTDVSNHSGSIDWSRLPAEGVKFGWAKATEGTSFIDSYFNANYHGAKNNGIYIGAYAFGRPDNGNGKAQADFLVDHSQYVNDGKTLPLQLDIEWPYWTKSSPIYPCYGLSTGQMVTWIRDFVNEVKARTGRDAAIYTNRNWWDPCTGSNSSFSANPLEIANYSGSPGTLPAGWSHFTAWQYAGSSSTLPGSPTVFNGTLGQLAAFAGNGDAAIPTGTLGDMNGDGRPDVVSRDGNGDLWLYANTGGTGANTFGVPSQIGKGWNTMTAINVADMNGDGRLDVVSRDGNGDLWLYANTGGTGANTFGVPSQIGTGWNSMTDID